jgi:hypothetical protein
MPKPEKLPHARRVDGGYTFVVELGPLTYHHMSPSRVAKSNREMRDALDRYARTLLSVGPYSNAVRTKVVKS